jgi:hypothetical protein
VREKLRAHPVWVFVEEQVSNLLDADLPVSEEELPASGLASRDPMEVMLGLDSLPR